jgi:hypothetical protein
VRTHRPSTDYHFVDRWRVRGTAREVADILEDVTGYARWWPSTYLEVTKDAEGAEHGVGQIGRVYAKGWLPYRIRFSYRVTEANPPHGFALDAWGDLTGRGVWRIEQDGDWVDVTYTWTVRSDKAILRYLSFLLKPVFRSNHVWTMRQGERSLQLEIDRRRAKTVDERLRVPDPPAPVPDVVWLAGTGASVAALWGLWRLGGRRWT